MNAYICPNCKNNKFDKGRAFDGRRAYRCKACKRIHTRGMQGRKKHYSTQRLGYQFADSRGKYHIS